ncbi:MAG TPA: serine hydrolase [Acidobacteriota bacterium]|jgi:beta-lactamase class A
MKRCSKGKGKYEKLRVHALVLLLTLCCTRQLCGSDLPDSVRAIVEHFKGKIYFAAKNLKTGEAFDFQGDQKVQTASVIKVPIMVEVFAQAKEHRFTLQDLMAFTEENRVPGSGILQDLGQGLHLTVKDATVLMIVLSDNSATNMLIDRVGVKAVNERMRRLGLSSTLLFKKVFRPATEPLPDEQKKWGLGVTTPQDMLLLFEKIYRKELVDAESSEQMISILKKQRDRDQIPRYFFGEKWSKVEVANKTGALDRVRNDVGIVFTPEGDFLLSLFAQDAEDQKWTPDNEATIAMARLSEALVTHFRQETRRKRLQNY